MLAYQRATVSGTYVHRSGKERHKNNPFMQTTSGDIQTNAIPNCGSLLHPPSNGQCSNPKMQVSSIESWFVKYQKSNWLTIKTLLECLTAPWWKKYHQAVSSCIMYQLSHLGRRGTPSHHPCLIGIFPNKNHPAIGYHLGVSWNRGTPKSST